MDELRKKSRRTRTKRENVEGRPSACPLHTEVKWCGRGIPIGEVCTREEMFAKG